MRIFVKIILVILIPVVVYPQPQIRQLDSLRSVLITAANDTLRMDVYHQLGDYFRYRNNDSSVFYLQKALSISRSLKLKLNEASILNSMGNTFISSINYSKALESLLAAKNIAQNQASEKITWHLPLAQTSQTVRVSLLSSIYSSVGWLYANTGDYTNNIDEQLENFRESIKLAESIHDSGLVAWGNLSLGVVYIDANKIDSGLISEQKAYSYFSNSSDKLGIGMSLKFIGDANRAKGNIEQARNALMKAVQVYLEMNNHRNLGWAYSSLSSLYSDIKKTDSSIYYAENALNEFKIDNSAEGMQSAYNLIYSGFDKLNNKDSTLKYIKLAKLISDSLNKVTRETLLASQKVSRDEQIRLQNQEKEKIETQNKIRSYTLLSGIAVFMLIAFLLYRNNRHRKKTNELLHAQKEKIEVQKNDVENALAELKSTQAQLIQSEKMASLGELTAGIAHEIQNPLNFVNNFSEVNKEMLAEMNQEIEKGNYDEVKAIAKDITDNEEKINHHGKRADSIVKGMLQHSITNTGHKELTDINALCDEYLRLSYHGFRAKDKSFNAKFETHFDRNIAKVNVIPQDIGRVILNLINNAFYTVSEKKKKNDNGYEPTVTVTTQQDNGKIEIKVRDNGNGIPQKNLDKIFQPFFTTKPTGQGTGLGLSLAYDIVTKGHGGELRVETKEGVGSEFIIQLP